MSCREGKTMNAKFIWDVVDLVCVTVVILIVAVLFWPVLMIACGLMGISWGLEAIAERIP